MEWYIAAIAVVALGVAAVVAAGGGGSMADDPVRDTYEMTVPEGAFDAAVVRELRFGVVLRGYAMDQVDTVLDRLAADLEARDARIAQLETQLEAQVEAPVTTSAQREPAPADISPGRDSPR